MGGRLGGGRERIEARGRLEPSPNFRRRETLRSGAGWRVRDAVTSGRSPLASNQRTRYTHPCLRVRGRTYTQATSIRDLQSAVHCRGCIYRRGLLLLLLLLAAFHPLLSSSGYLIARVNKFSTFPPLLELCKSLILFLHVKRKIRVNI